LLTIFFSFYKKIVGSELDRKIKHAASELETAWEGMGQQAEVRVWRIEKFKVVPWAREKYGMFHKGDSYIGM
jgi:gelsolin